MVLIELTPNATELIFLTPVQVIKKQGFFHTYIRGLVLEFGGAFTIDMIAHIY